MTVPIPVEPTTSMEANSSDPHTDRVEHGDFVLTVRHAQAFAGVANHEPVTKVL
jgi:hypothetical protein